MTDLRGGGWATPSEELTALLLEARRQAAEMLGEGDCVQIGHNRGRGNDMTIYCSCCGRKLSFSYSAHNVLRAIYTLGWGSFGSALYCPECTRTWSERNVGRPMPGPKNTIRVIDCMYQPERGPCRRRSEEGAAEDVSNSDTSSGGGTM